MKIKAINTYNLKANATQSKYSPGFLQSVSFCANDSFERAIPDKKELIEKLLDTKNRAIQLIQEHNSTTDDIVKSAIAVQKQDSKKKLTHTLETFQATIGLPEMKPIVDVYKKISNYFRTISTSPESGEILCSPSPCAALSSVNKQLADDVIDLYPFYIKAKYNQEISTNYVGSFTDMLARGYKYNYSSVPAALSQNAMDFCNEYQNNLIDTLEDSERNFKKNGFPTVIAAHDMQTLMDNAINESRNVASLKEYTSCAGEDYMAAILYSLENPHKKTLDRGVLQPHRTGLMLDLDTMGVTQEMVDDLKKARKDLAPQLEKLEKIYSKMTGTDFKRMREINKLSFEYIETGKELLRQYPDCIPITESLFKTSYGELIRFDPKGSTTTLIEKLINLQTQQATQGIEKPLKEIVSSAAQEPLKNKKAYGKSALIIAAGVAIATGIFAFIKLKNRKTPDAKIQNTINNIRDNPTTINQAQVTPLKAPQSMNDFMNSVC